MPRIQVAGGAHVDVALEKRQVERAYELLAPVYDFVFDWIFAPGRQAAISHLGLTLNETVLEVGIGTGLNLPLYPPSCRLTGIDLSGEMLDKAVERTHKLAMPGVVLKVMDATSMDFADNEFDKALATYTISAVPDPIGVLREMRRVVKPGGKVAAMVYAALEKNPYHGIFYRVVRRLGKIPSPAPGEPWMYALGDPGALEDVYRRAGFLNVSVHAVPIPRRFPSAADAIRSMRNSAGDLRELMSRLHDADRELAWAEIEQQLRQFEGPNGFEAPGEVLIGVGTK